MTDLVGLDVGTTGVKALRISSEGEVLARAEESYPLATPEPGWAEQNPEDWWRASEAALAAGPAFIVQAVVGIDAGFGVGLELTVGVDGRGQFGHLLRRLDPQRLGRDPGSVQRHEDQPPPAGKPDLDGAELRHVGRRVATAEVRLRLRVTRLDVRDDVTSV